MIDIKIRDRRGSIQDLVLIIGVIFVFALIAIFGHKILFEFDSQAGDQFGTEGGAILDSGLEDYPTLFDNIIFYVFILLSLISLVFAALVRINPIFVIFYIIIFIFIIITSAALSNAYEAITTNPQLIDIAASYTKTNWLLTYLPLLTLILGVLIMIISYKNWREER